MNRLPLRIALIAIVLPFAIAVAGVALQLAWLPDLPATITTHWAFDGTADGFGPAWSMPVLLGALGLGIPSIFGLVLARTVGPAGPTATQKLLAVTALFATTLLSIVLTTAVAIQRGRSVGDPSPEVLPVLGIALLAAALLSGAGWYAMPRAVSGASAPRHEAPAVPVAPGERVAWVGRARFATGVLVALGVTVALVTGALIFAAAATGLWVLLVVPAIVGIAVLGSAGWRVRVDADGLSARGLLGWPRFRVPLSDIAGAAVTHVVPLGEFGGYGVRWGRGRRLGIVTRGGEALEVQRRDGRAVVVTVDDAATAAGLLTALQSPPARR